ncbi:MAG: flagellar hook-basal body complex protein [Verrucomicrobiota bacterium]
MLGSLNSGVSGLRQFQTKMDVIGNNIANSNTIAFKAARADFADALSQTLQAPSSGQGTPAMQVGTGVSTTAIKNIYDPGSTARTGVQTDLAISGDGFFVVKDTIDDHEYATRAGDFRVDDTGYLVTNSGLRVQGYSDGTLATRGDIQIDGTGRPATSSPTATVQGFSIDQAGKITVRLSDNTQFVRGQILLQNFQNPQALVKQGNSIYSGINDAGPLGGATPQTEAPGTSGLGQIQTGTLELSNVDLTEEFANLITTQRGFQASARVITTSDELLQELVNLKR